MDDMDRSLNASAGPDESGEADPTPTPAVMPPVMAAGSMEEFDRLVEEVEKTAREWGLRSHSLESRFVTALLGCTRWMGRLSEASQSEFKRLFEQNRDAAELELARAREITKAANAALGQARSALINLQVERENVTLRMIHETMPMFATELRKALIYRVKDESDGLRLRRFFVAALLTLCVFVGGFELRAWNDSAAVGALGHCLSHPLQAQGRIYCDVTSFRDSGQ
jgi:hypothetical protein